MHRRLLIGACCALTVCCCAELAWSQIRRDAATEGAAPQLELGAATTTRYRVGATIRARNGPVQNIRVMVALPWVCDEQQATVVQEDVSPQISLDERTLDGGQARQMLIYIPSLGAGEEAHAIIAYDVATHVVLPPENTAELRIPVKPSLQLKKHLGPSPFIDVRHRKISAAVNEAFKRIGRDNPKPDVANEDKTGQNSDGAIGVASRNDPTGAEREGHEAAVDGSDASSRINDSVIVDSVIVVDVDDDVDDDAHAEPDAGSSEASQQEVDQPASNSASSATPPANSVPPGGAEEPTDWQRVEAIYDFVLENVKYEEGRDKSSVQTLTQGKGDCQAIGALFVAMCRTAKVPARLVWVHDHQYAEFYLENQAGAGRWYPVETAGQRAFGEMPTARVILQRGDNFRVPERPRDRLRYASDYALFLSSPDAKPKIAYIRERQ